MFSQNRFAKNALRFEEPSDFGFPTLGRYPIRARYILNAAFFLLNEENNFMVGRVPIRSSHAVLGFEMSACKEFTDRLAKAVKFSALQHDFSSERCARWTCYNPRVIGHEQRIACLNTRLGQAIIFFMPNNQHFRKWRLMGVLCVLLTVPVAAQEANWEHELAAWRSQHLADLMKPAGWLSLTGLEWLQPGDNSFGTAADNKIHLVGNGAAHIGILHLDGTNVQLLPPSGGFPADLRVADAPASPQLLTVEADSDKNAQHLTIGTLNMYVIRREDRFALRVKDSKSPTLVGFHGLNWYPPNIRYRVKAKWIPYNPPKSVTLATLAGTTYSQPVPGAAEFVLEGKTFRLEPVLEDPAAPQLFFILKDATSSTTTYHACRFLYTVLPSNGLAQPGELVLDLNRLENPPCAYTSFATCPLPPPQNRLPIALPVGEKRYHD